jgi:hypothetical protein
MPHTSPLAEVGIYHILRSSGELAANLHHDVWVLLYAFSERMQGASPVLALLPLEGGP